mgnify:CR=1 FL=1
MFHRLIRTLDLYDGLRLPVQIGREELLLIHEDGDTWLVQRAIRSPGHCDYTAEEQINAFEDMVAWEQGGPKPAGDDFLDPATVAADDFGCQFTTTDRSGVPACTTPP